jgi:endonuclease/exonuclease/phosphatase family metal-dependent hydrolase
MSQLKIIVWNMEWMNDLFGPNDKPPAFRPDGDKPQHNDKTAVGERRDSLYGVIKELQPDLLVVVEGPNRQAELQLFFDGLGMGHWNADIQYSKGQTQNVGFAVRTDLGKFADPPFKRFDTANDKAFDEFLIDTDDDAIQEKYKYERRPLYAEVYLQDGGKFRILGLHLKSKGIFESYEWSKWWAMADANRRKLLAQATQLRLRFLEPYMRDGATKNIPLIVCGDINDGPGLDASEKKLFGSAVERIMGTVWEPWLCLRNALYDPLGAKQKSALDFSSIHTTNFKDPIFNYTYHKVWIDHILYTDNQDSQWVKDAEVHIKMQGNKPIWEKYKHASDHYPVSAIIEL